MPKIRYFFFVSLVLTACLAPNRSQTKNFSTDLIVLEFRQRAREALDSIEKLGPDAASALASIDVAKVRKLAAEARVSSTDPVTLNGQVVEAGFDKSENAIYVSRSLWPKMNENAQRRLALHEFLWFLGDEDASGSISSQLPDLSPAEYTDTPPLKPELSRLYIAFSFDNGARVPSDKDIRPGQWWECIVTNVRVGGYKPKLRFDAVPGGFRIVQSFLHGLLEPEPDLMLHAPAGGVSDIVTREKSGLVMKFPTLFSNLSLGRETWRISASNELIGELAMQTEPKVDEPRFASQAFPKLFLSGLISCKTTF